jgi:hypothetical protein
MVGGGLFDMALLPIGGEEDNVPVPLQRRQDTLAPAALCAVPVAAAQPSGGPVAKGMGEGMVARAALRALQLVAVASVSAAIAITVTHHRSSAAAASEAAPGVMAPATAPLAPPAPAPLPPPVVAPAVATVAAAIPAVAATVAPPAHDVAPVRAPAPLARAARTNDPAAPEAAAGSLEAAPTAPPPAAAPEGTADMPAIPALPPPPTVSIDRGAAAVAIASAGRGAACAETEGTLVVPVAVIFGANGHVQSARVTGGSLAGTPDGACVARALRVAAVPAFDGEPVTVNTNVRVR